MYDKTAPTKICPVSSVGIEHRSSKAGVIGSSPIRDAMKKIFFQIIKKVVDKPQIM